MDASESFLDFLSDRKILDAASLSRARSAIAASRQPIDVVLLELGLLAEAPLADHEAQFLGIERAGPESFLEDVAEPGEIPMDFLRRMGLVPLAVEPGGIAVATARPFEADTVRALSYFLDRPVTMKVATHSDIASYLKRTGAQGTGNEDHAEEAVSIEEDVERLKDVAREAPIIRLVSRLISEAVERHASDIHVEPLEDRVRVRFRIDGVLINAEELPKHLQPGLISRIKIMARLNIAEQRLPQDGRIKVPVRGNEIDLRVSTVPTLYGESVVLRILDRKDVALDFASLGFSAPTIARIRDLIRQPNGIFLVTGPTGSGKTTTLYAALTELNTKESKLFTVEDPVEYHLDGVNQTHVRPQIGLDFAHVLRSILRQDPDIIMVGEIRDRETAAVAIQASLTGHLVLSTLHTNSAAAAISRLLDMGVEDYLLVSTLRGVLAQRLVRKLCPHCRHETRSGCNHCHGIGYQGRAVIHELLEVDEAIRSLVMKHAPDTEIEASARAKGMASLLETGMAKISAGETTLEEVKRVTSSS